MKKILNLKPYSHYKPFGVEWLGDIPAHWEVRRMKQVSWIQGGFAFPADSFGNEGVPVVRMNNIRRGVLDLDDVVRIPEHQCQDTFALKEGDIIYGLSGSIGATGSLGNYAVVRKGDIPAQLNQRVARFRPVIDRITERFLVRSLQTSVFYDQVLSHTTGTAQFNVSTNDISNVALALPPVEEQRRIVCYLDQADERIRRYVSSRERLIELLEEYRQAVIHHAVTRGLDPDVRLKPSSVEWLGDVPAHWEVRRVKQVSRILRGKFTHRPRNDPSLYNGPYPFIQTGDVARAKKTITEYSQTLNKQGLAVSLMFPTGTLVMTIAANIGDVAILDFEACFPDSVVGFVPRQNVYRDYLYYLFRAMKAEFLRETPVNTQGNLNVERIGSRHIALPPISEQISIVAYLDKATADIDVAIDRARREIGLLGEYRTRLIADVVTGKVDVREAAAELSEPLFNGQK